MYKKLIFFGILVLLAPIPFIPGYEYIDGLGWWGIEVMPDVQFHGIQWFFCLLVLASVLFFIGLAQPKIAIWFGEKTRRRSSTVYGIAGAIAIVGLVEVNLIALGIYAYEDRKMVSLYEGVELGISMDEVKDQSIFLNRHLGYSYSLAEFEKQLLAYDQSKNYVDFTYPNQFRASRMRMIVETSLYPGDEGSQVIGKFLLVNNRIARSEI